MSVQDKDLTRAELEAAYPDMVAEIKKDGFSAGYGEGLTKGREEGAASGAQAERDRIKAVREQGVPGQEALLESMLWDGKTTAGEAALQILAAERTLRATKASEFRADGASVVPQPPVDGAEGETVPEAKGWEALVAEYQAGKKCSKVEAIRAVARAHPEEHDKYIAGLSAKK